MFSGKHDLKKHKDRVFIDRDGPAFENMLSFLRTGKVPPFNNRTEEEAFTDELEFWQIPLNHETFPNELIVET